MNSSSLRIVICALPLCLQFAEAETATNRNRLVPVSNLEAARDRGPVSNFGRIATNTPAFEEYAVGYMLAKANKVSERWQLDTPKPMTISDVYFQVRPTAFGIEGSIGTRDLRFSWAFTRNAFGVFQDHKYWPRSFRYKDDESARLAQIKSKITAEEARSIAVQALHALGTTEKELRLKEETEVNQYKFEESDGRVYPLPIFNVRWRVEGPRRFAAQNLEYTPIEMEISGITKKVVEYHNVVMPADPIPTNYFPMLGLPTNYLETLPDAKRRSLGLPALTNTVSQSTNVSARPTGSSE